MIPPHTSSKTKELIETIAELQRQVEMENDAYIEKYQEKIDELTAKNNRLTYELNNLRRVHAEILAILGQ